jgi:hypothetical protein
MKIKELLESRIKLDADERGQVDTIVPKIIEKIQGPTIPKGKYEYVDDIHYHTADSRPRDPKIAMAKIWVANDNDNALAYYQTNDPKDITDNHIVFQQNGYYSNPTVKSDLKVYSKVTGAGDILYAMVRNTLVHELIHAKDPSINYFRTPLTFKDGSTDPNNKSKYYGSKFELETFSSSIYEIIEHEVDKALKANLEQNELKRLLGVLKDILLVFSGKQQDFSVETYDFFDLTIGNRNFIQKTFTVLDKFVRKVDKKIRPGTLSSNFRHLQWIKHHNPEGYNHFLKNLYKVVVASKEKIELALKNS